MNPMALRFDMVNFVYPKKERQKKVGGKSPTRKPRIMMFDKELREPERETHKKTFKQNERGKKRLRLLSCTSSSLSRSERKTLAPPLHLSRCLGKTDMMNQGRIECSAPSCSPAACGEN